MIFKILDRDENYIKNIEGFDYEYSWSLNGIESLSFTTYESGLEPLYRILYQDLQGKWIEFIITEPVDEHSTTEGVVYSVYAANSFYETDGDWLEDKRPQNTTALQALETALQPSRWEVGHIDDLGLNSTNFYRESTRSAVLEKIVPTWRAELETKITVKDNKITNRTVNLHKQIGSFWGKRFVFKKDMDKIKRTINTDDFCTALYGFGKGEEIFDDDGESTGGYGRRIDFAEVNNGKSYVENLEAKELFGRNSPNGKQHIFGKVEFDQCEDKNELMKLTLAELEKRSKFNVTYECDVIDLGIEFESVNKGDTVIVKDNDLGICISARIFEYKEKDNGKIHIKLGNYQPLMVDELNKSKEFLDQFRSKQGVWDRSGMLSENGLDGSMVDNLIKALNEELNGTGGYVYFSDDGKGMITYDKPIDKNPTKAIQILGGSFRMANEKLANGEWNWRTIGTGDGLVADAITTGVLNASLIKAGALVGKGFNLDMESGSFNLADKITYNPSSNSFVIDGNTVIRAINNGTIRIAGSSITLDGNVNMTSSFTVPSGNIGDLSADKITSGTIDAETINVKNLNADNLTQGTVRVGVNNSSASLPSGSAGAQIHGGATDLNTNSSKFNFAYARNAFEVQGRINAMPEGNNHALELNGLTLNANGTYAGIKPWGGYIRCEGNSWHFQEIKTSNLYLGGKKLILEGGTVKYEEE